MRSVINKAFLCFLELTIKIDNVTDISGFFCLVNFYDSLREILFYLQVNTEKPYFFPLS